MAKLHSQFIGVVTSAIHVLVFLGLMNVCTGREFVSTEDLIERMPIIFIGKLSAREATIAPTKENILSDSDEALRLRFVEVKWWKPQLHSKFAEVFTWTSQKASCRSPELTVGKKYVVFGETDSSKRFLLADSCGHINTSETPDGAELTKTIDRVLKKERHNKSLQPTRPSAARLGLIR